MLAAVRDDATPAAAIVAATGGDVVGGDSYDIPTTPHWHNDRMVLTGDAAHAASPAAAQGASMALEDAVALAAALREHGSGGGVRGVLGDAAGADRGDRGGQRRDGPALSRCDARHGPR
ncbi:hypothetical protein GCM10020358_28570 [Amorphoplanes nipponensis]